MGQLISIFNDGVIGEDDSTTSNNQPTGIAVNISRTGNYLTFTINELREFGCYAASTGLGLEPYKSRLATVAEARRTAIQGEAALKTAEPQKRLDAIQNERSELLSRVDPDAKHTTEAALKFELATQNATLQGLFLEAKADREAIAAQERHRLAQEKTDREHERLKGQIGYAETMLTVLQQDRNANQSEIQRQASRLEERSRDTFSRLQEARIRVRQLTESGITRNVAGFLVWGSYASLIGAGVAVTQIVHRALSAAETKPEDSLLVSWLKNIDSPLKLMQLFGSFIGVVLLALLVIAGFTLLIRYLLRRFDPAWRASSVPPQNTGDDNIWSEWLEMFGVSRRIGGKAVTDHSLQQIVGLLPVVVAAAAMAFLFVAFGDRSAVNVSFLASQIGPAFLMLSLVAAALFVTNVVTAVQAKKPVSRSMVLLFGLISILPFASLLLAGLNGGQKGTAAITAVAIAMTLAATGLAFGLIYRGQFMTEDALESEIEDIELNVVYLRVAPTVRRVLVQLAQEETWNTEAAQRWHARWFMQFKHFFSSLKFWERWRVISNINNEIALEKAITRLDVSGQRLQEINHCQIKREGLKSAVTQFEAWATAEKDARTVIDKAMDRHRSQMRDLAIEEERALLELENAFNIASASLGETLPPPTAELALAKAAGK